MAVDVHNESVVRVGHINLHLAKSNINGDADVHVGELRLCGEEHSAPLWQIANGGVVEAVGLGCGVEAVLAVHVELAVALAPIHRGAIERVFALCALGEICE